ncbi:MAG: AAA domain-containing protein [Actinomycetota bacterium]|nr:AAA domain-containing protein [Actinomycetota bacterium]
MTSVDDAALVGQEAQDRSLRYLDFLEAYHLNRFPPVRDIGDYRDVQVTESNVPKDSLGVAFIPGGEAWLIVDLVDLPPVPAMPPEWEDWVSEPVTAGSRPVVRHPDPVAAALIALMEEPPDGELSQLDELGADALAARGLHGVAAGSVVAAAVAARTQVEAAEQGLGPWLAQVWQPWSARWLNIDTSRAFYKALFDLRVRLERERETFELVWAFGRTRWMAQLDGGPVRVDHPLLTVAVEVELERASGRLRVLPEGALSVETSWTVGLALSDRAGLADARSSVQQIEIDPWGVARKEMVAQLLRSLDQDGRLLRLDERPTFGSEAVADPEGWVLLVRRRRPKIQGFIDAQRALYRDGVAVPAPFAALVIDQPSLLDDPSGGDLVEGDRDGESAETAWAADAEERYLLPLPANEEQLEIVSLARSRAGVTAQGPPGTGKSHTIANLVSHYLAHGKRVLVTAEKEQALRVLIEKIPEDIRGLCVPVLGSDATGRAEIQRTVSEIAAGSQRRPDREAIRRLADELDRIDSQYSVTTNLLRVKRTAETGAAPHRPPSVPIEEWTPSAAARWVADHHHLVGITDNLDRHAPPPLSGAEFLSAEALCRRIGSDDGHAALQELPNPSALPTGGQLASLAGEAERLRMLLADIEERIVGWERVDGLAAATTEALTVDLERWIVWHTKAAGSWVGEVLKAARDKVSAAVWRDFIDAATAERDAVLAINSELAADAITVTPPSDGSLAGPDLIAGLNEARARFAAGKSVGTFQRAARRALEHCSTNGHTPSTIADLDLIGAELARRDFRQRLLNRWVNTAVPVGAPLLPSERSVEDAIGEYLAEVTTALDWSDRVWPQLAERLSLAGVRAPADPDGAELGGLERTCRSLGERARLVDIEGNIGRIAAHLEAGAAARGASPLWADLRGALVDRAYTRFDELRTEAQRLADLAPEAAGRRDLLCRLRVAAPLLTDGVEATGTPIDPAAFEQCWMWRQLWLWLADIDEGPQPAELQARLERLARDRRRIVTDLVAARAWAALSDSIDDRRRTALNRFTTANSKLGKGTGRYAPMWAAQAREAMVDAQDAVPVWIMPLHRALDSFRPAADPPFDVVIVDEASQVGLLETPVLGLGRRAIIVGDDQQTSPEIVGVDRQGVFDLIDDFLGAIGDRKTRFSPDNSLYDIARQRFPQIVQLREHFRCLPRIIEFSSQRWYAGSIIPLRDRPPRPGWQPVGTVYVPGGVRRYNDDTNPEEADAIVDLIAQLIADPDYEGMTFGVVTLLGSGQARLISGNLIDRFGATGEIEDRRIRVGDPADFQGDERDVVILSTVVAHDVGGRLFGAMTGAAANRRINVAASRAANQLWMVHSVGPEDFNAGDPRRWLLEYCSSASDDDGAIRVAAERTESVFEAEVLKRIVGRGYTRVHAQYPVGGYRIDLVVEGPENRLAVECDGDYWHGPDVWDRDRSRQTVLERAGWTFERIRGSSFYRDPDAALEPLWQRLAELDIPTGDWAGDLRPSPAQRRWPDDFPERLAAIAEAVEPTTATALSRDRPAPVAAAEPWASLADADSTSHLNRPGDDQTGMYRLIAPRSPTQEPSTREVRQWAGDHGYQVGERGRLHPEVITAWNAAFPNRPFGR